MTSKMGAHLTGDPRDIALREALSAALTDLKAFSRVTKREHKTTH